MEVRNSLGGSLRLLKPLFLSQNSVLTSSQGDFLGGTVYFPRLLK